ncbi:MAG: hypothetical protein H6721_25965 [Sandaracinus sp.]|nr:hypothetical protein [Sandaracinus sp.]MCB9612027.1 hypothetical protein [Sandaracinus sp.]MCB9635580.1 hypothetical protein [Sandaracinus sp.]
MTGLRTRTLAACLAVSALCASASAQETARVVTPLPADLDERLEGQTTDLDWRLTRTRMPVPRDLDDAARRSRGARVVIWVETLETGLRLHFVDVRDRRLLVRDFAAPNDEAFGGSANLEAVAVAVRSALQALSLGGEVGVAAPPPVVAEPEPIPVPTPPPEPATPTSVEAEAGWWLALDGESPTQHGPSLRFALRRKRLVVGLGGEVGLGVRLQDELTRVTVTRHAATVDLGVGLLDGTRGSLDLLARAGIARFRRGEVETRVDGLSPAPAESTTSALAGLRLVGTFAPTPNLGIRLSVGADALPAAPVLRYADEAGNTQIRNRFWVLQPTIALTLVIRSRPDAPSPAPESNGESAEAHFFVTRFSPRPPPWKRWQ